MNEVIRRTRWKVHFFPLGVAFLITGSAALLEARQLATFDSWRLAALAVVIAGLFVLLQRQASAGERESVGICIAAFWVSAGILRVGGLGLLQLYPALMALLGLCLLLDYAGRRIARS
jgi:hypothetical protein